MIRARGFMHSFKVQKHTSIDSFLLVFLLLFRRRLRLLVLVATATGIIPQRGEDLLKLAIGEGPLELIGNHQPAAVLEEPEHGEPDASSFLIRSSELDSACQRVIV